MGLTVSLVREGVTGDLRWAAADITFDSSYPTGGESLTAADLGFTAAEPYAQIIKLVAGHKGGYTFDYDYTNHKLIAYLAGAHTHDLFLKNADQADGAGTRVNATTDKLGQNTGDVTVHGQAAGASAHGGVLGVAAAALAEVGNTISLSTVTVRVLAWASK